MFPEEDLSSWYTDSEGSCSTSRRSDSSDSSDSSSSESTDRSSSENPVEVRDPLNTTFLRRRRPIAASHEDSREVNGSARSTQSAEQLHNNRRKRTSLKHVQVYHALGCNTGRCSSFAVLLAFLVWLNTVASYHPFLAQFWHDMENERDSSEQVMQRSISTNRDQELMGRLKKNPPKLSTNYHGAAANFPHRKRKDSLEKPPPGCNYTAWQRTAFPDCNRLHELDLRQVLPFRKPPAQSSSQESKYISSGMWRDVFRVADETGELTVLKMMKPEHDLTLRNLDRHRRDALAMEHLTASTHIVDLFSYCSNTVLTEYLPLTLQDSLSTDLTSTSRQRLRLAMESARSVAELHAQDIIHADLQSQQFLVVVGSSSNNGDVRVKLNDFNRGRFVPRHVETNESCPVRIPSAPGPSRSPEEYTMQDLTIAVDVFSLGYVLWDILVRGAIQPFSSGDRVSVGTIKSKVEKGVTPFLPKEFRENPLDAALASLMQRCFAKDIKIRITATELAEELEEILLKSDAKNSRR